jgi:hypothetical protein
MATDKSEPRVGLIAQVGAFSIVVLLATRAALGTYFDFMEQAEKQRKVGSVAPEALMSLRASESARLSGGPMPIDKAMDELASRGRMGIGPELAPGNSKDVAPLQGWAKMPSEVPAPMLADAGPEAPMSATLDAGGRAGADAGHIHTGAGKTDAGAKAPARTPSNEGPR